MTETEEEVHVHFIVPKTLLEEFDRVVKELAFQDRTAALLALMRKFVKYGSINKAAKEA